MPVPTLAVLFRDDEAKWGPERRQNADPEKNEL
jgi:hypothetical protein